MDNHNDLYMCLIVTLPNERTVCVSMLGTARLDARSPFKKRRACRAIAGARRQPDELTHEQRAHARRRAPHRPGIGTGRWLRAPAVDGGDPATALAEPDRRARAPRRSARSSRSRRSRGPPPSSERSGAARVLRGGENASARARSAADIPRLIHQFTHLPDDDSKAHGLLRTEARVRAVHRGWCVRYWDDDELAAFVNASFAGAVADAYFKFPPGVIRSDIARYLLVSTYGGWYLDTDIKCSQPLDTLHGRGGVVLTRTAPNPRQPPRPDFRPLVANFVFGSAPDHPFWELVLDEVASLPDPPREGLHDHLDIAMMSGPGLMQRVWARLGEAASATLGVVLEENARLGAWRSPIEKRVWDPYENTTVTPVCVHYNLFSWLRSSASGGASSAKLETRTALTKEEEDRRSRARRDWICSGGSATVMCRGHGSDRSGDDPNDDFV